MVKQCALNTLSKWQLEKLKQHQTLSGITPFISCNFSLIKRSNTGRLFWLYNAESDFVSKYNQVLFFLAISSILHSVSRSSLLQCEV